MVKNKIYLKSPVILQNFLLSGRGVLYNYLRKGAIFKKISSELMQTQYFDRQDLEKWQTEKLISLVGHAFENVPYYNRVFKKFKLTPQDIRGIEDLCKLPLLTKEDIRKNPEDFLAKNIKRPFLNKAFTSGTSGKPLRLYRDLYSINFESAIWWRQRQWAGVDFTDRIAILREEPIVPINKKDPPFWRHSVLENTLYLSSYHLCEKNTLSYSKAIEDFAPTAIEAEPSSLYLLAGFMKKKNLIPSIPIKAVFTSSEVLLKKHKSLIEEVFGARVFDFYGNAERVAAIGTCEHGRYHVLPEYGIAEFLPVDRISGKLEIIGTSLHNYAMPLLRYRTGDLIKLSDARCECQRNFREVGKIDGRVVDFLISADGRATVEACCLALDGIEHIVESQIIQERLDRIRIKFLPAEGFSAADQEKMVKNIKTFMGTEVDVILEKTREFIDDRRTKFRPFISLV